MTQNIDILHKDFHYLLELAIDLFDDWEKGFKIVKTTLSGETRVYRDSFSKIIMLTNNSYTNELPIPHNIRNIHIETIIEFYFEDGIFFTVDNEFLTCYFSENKISGVNYFSVDSETREALYMEKKLFGK